MLQFRYKKAPKTLLLQHIPIIYGIIKVVLGAIFLKNSANYRGEPP